MKREQIIHALYTQKVIGNIDLMELLEKAGYKDYSISAIIDRITDAILALPLDVPDSDFLLDILLKVNEYVRQENQFIATEYVGVFKEWMRDEMIKRNK